jgi:hypothetical protein
MNRVLCAACLGVTCAGWLVTPPAGAQVTKPRAEELKLRYKLARWHKGFTGAWVNSVAFSPDGAVLASGHRHQAVKLWDLATGKNTATLAHQGAVYSVAFSPDGKLLAAGGGGERAGELKLWRVARRTPVADFKGLRRAIRWVAFSPDGKLLAASNGGETRLWELGNKKEKTTFPGNGPLAFSPGGKALALVGGKVSERPSIRLWDVAAGKVTATLGGYKGTISAVAFSPDGKTLGSVSSPYKTGGPVSEVKLWDVATAKEEASFEARDEELTGAAFSRDFKRLALATRESFLDAVLLWDLPGRRQRALAEIRGWNVRTHLAFSPDGKVLAVGAARGISVWDVVPRARAAGDKTSAWLAEWECPNATRPEWRSSGTKGKAFNAVMVTTDDFEQVRLHYAKKTLLWKVDFNVPGIMRFRSKVDAWIDGVAQVGLNEDVAKLLGIDPAAMRTMRATLGGRWDNVEPARPGKEAKRRPVSVVALFRDTSEYTVHVVVSRARDEKHTHIIVTYLRKRAEGGRPGE